MTVKALRAFAAFCSVSCCFAKFNTENRLLISTDASATKNPANKIDLPMIFAIFCDLDMVA